VTIVVDASAIIAVIFEEPSADAIEDCLVGQQLVAPVVLALEVANACIIRKRRQPPVPLSAKELFDLFEDWSVRLLPVDYGGVIGIAGATGLTAYAASYLWLARYLECGLVTLDRRLSSAASATP